MKKTFVVIATLVAATGLLLTSCSPVTPAGVGVLYTDVATPLQVLDNHGKLGTKVGRSSCTAILGLVATGDASVNEAAKQGGITRITHIDQKQKSILGLFGSYEVVVYGE